ncbi:MAG: hypothetical protein M1828_001489 [Chrysothrix sp. TS-e1954]|nr:MAG: hypothetical protein M1828_001489 [Chrysothrix sp. TS-e1954]
MDSFTLKGEADQADPRATLRHVLVSDDQYPDPTNLTTSMDWSSINPQSQPPNGALDQHDDMEGSAQNTAMTTTTRRNASGSVSSVYSGNRIRFLKKDDGQPLWRKDIQFLFLRMVFEDDHRVFTKASDGTGGHTFADIYIDAMAKSSKCSQILKEKLLSDRSSALQMAMICLLVNVGRMNTTLNFFPEMRARVRTYHSIPCLQAQQGAQAYKQLQDGPRLKSILKGATEDVQQPGTVDDITKHPKPRTNPVNLIFVLSQYAPRISETHFFPPRDFFDLFMRSTLSSQSRARAFLWLVWWYLESDFSIEDTQQNPFGRGMPGDDNGMPTKVPALEVLTEEQAESENVDTEEEVAYGESKRREREAIVANDMPPTANAPKRGQKTAIMEHQHNYRFRHSPFGSSASDSGGSRGRPSASPPPGTQSTDLQGRQRAPKSDGDRTRSPSPLPQATPRRRQADPSAPSAPHGVQINSLLNEDARGLPSSTSKAAGDTSRKSASRTKSTRKPSERTRSDQQPTAPEGMAGVSPSGVPYEPSLYHHRQSYIDQLRPNPYVPIGLAAFEGNGRAAYSSYSGPSYPYHRPVMTSPDPPSGGRRSKPAPSTEQLRRERVKELLYERIQDVRLEKRRERRRRGVLTDAWMKCNALPDGWDSDDDVRDGLGGLDEFEVIDTTDEKSGKRIVARDGDIGEHSRRVAQSLREIGHALDHISIPKPQKFTFKEYDSSLPFPPTILPSETGPRTSTLFESREPRDKRLAPPAQDEARLNTNLDEDMLPPPKRKRPATKQPKSSRKSQTSTSSKRRSSPSAATGSRKSTRSVRRSSKSRGDADVEQGHQGVYVDDFFAGQSDEDGEPIGTTEEPAATKPRTKPVRGEAVEEAAPTRPRTKPVRGEAVEEAAATKPRTKPVRGEAVEEAAATKPRTKPVRGEAVEGKPASAVKGKSNRDKQARVSFANEEDEEESDGPEVTDLLPPEPEAKKYRTGMAADYEGPDSELENIMSMSD